MAKPQNPSEWLNMELKKKYENIRKHANRIVPDLFYKTMPFWSKDYKNFCMKKTHLLFLICTEKRAIKEGLLFFEIMLTDRVETYMEVKIKFWQDREK